MATRISRWLLQTVRRSNRATLGSSPLNGYPSLSNLLSSKRLRLITSISNAGLILILLVWYHNALLTVLAWPRSKYSYTAKPPDLAVVADIDWSRFAYTQYVTNSDYLCNSVMLFEILHRLGSKADRVIMYPSYMVNPDAREAETDDGRLLVKARDQYGVHLVPISVQHRNSADETWDDSFTKLFAFNQTQYSRVLSLDSDSVILQTMDELFLLPPCPVAMPRAYWLYPDKKILSSQVMLVQPSTTEFQRVMDKMKSGNNNDYDMEIVNDLYQDSALVLPHRPYDLLTAEFRTYDHMSYLGSDREAWDAVTIYNEAKFVHFSDWPVPKPWISMPDNLRDTKQPNCHTKDGVEQCIEREIWNGFYHDFQRRRENVCRVGRSRHRLALP